MEPSNLTSDIGLHSTTQYGLSLVGHMVNVVHPQAQNMGTYRVSRIGTLDPNGNIFHKTTAGIQVNGAYNIVLGINGITHPLPINGNYKLYFPVVGMSGEVLTSSINLTPEQYRSMKEMLLDPRPVMLSSENATAYNSPGGVAPLSSYGAVNQRSRSYDRDTNTYSSVAIGSVNIVEGVNTETSDWVDITEQLRQGEYQMTFDPFTPIEEVDNTNNNEEEDLYF